MHLHTALIAVIGYAAFCPTTCASNAPSDLPATAPCIWPSTSLTTVALDRPGSRTPWPLRSQFFSGADLPRTYRSGQPSPPSITFTSGRTDRSVQVATNALLLLLSATGKVTGYGRDTTGDIGKPPLGIRPDPYTPPVRGSIR